MREMNLTFRNPDEVLDFVKTVEQYPFDMDLCRGSVVVDAKSWLQPDRELKNLQQRLQ